MEKPADTHFPIHDLLSRRWSPRAFAEKRVEHEKIQRLLEAARWASSCFNEQPWTFIVATADQAAEHGKLVSCLVEGNQVWAKQAPLLMITVAKLYFDHNGQPNRHAFHDVGLSVGQSGCTSDGHGPRRTSNGRYSSRYDPHMLFTALGV